MSRAPSSLPELLADESDPDLARLLPDQTATDLAPLGADATGEIEAIDIVEVSPPSPPPPRAAYPSSIAPIALNVTPPRVSLASLPSWVPTPTSTQQLARAAGIPVFSARSAVIATSVIGMCLIAGTVGAVLGYSRVSAREPTVATGQQVVHAPRIAVVLSAREEITEAPLTAPAKAPPPASRVATGVVHVPGAVTGALVDGTPYRVVGGDVTVACGPHRVKLPGRSVRLVTVPCGGSTTF